MQKYSRELGKNQEITNQTNGPSAWRLICTEREDWGREAPTGASRGEWMHSPRSSPANSARDGAKDSHEASSLTGPIIYFKYLTKTDSFTAISRSLPPKNTSQVSIHVSARWIYLFIYCATPGRNETSI